jgi:hypothetical protein
LPGRRQGEPFRLGGRKFVAEGGGLRVSVVGQRDQFADDVGRDGVHVAAMDARIAPAL